MPIIPTPYDDKIGALKDRLDHKGSQPKARRKLDLLNARSYHWQQNNRPPTPTPWSAKYETEVSSLNRDLNDSQTDIAGRRLATEQRYGFNDQSNPFSEARNLEARWRTQRANTTNSYAAQGQLYSGALSRARTADETDAVRGLDSVSRNYTASIAELEADALRAQRTHDEGVTAAEAERLEAALNAPVDPSEIPTPPKGVKKWEKNLAKRAQRFDRQGRDHKAKKIRERLARVKGAK